MKPPVSITSTSDGFNAGDECFYKAYLNLNSVNSESVLFGNAKCGFNKGVMAYCDQQIGDPLYQSYISDLKYMYSKVST